MRWRRFLALYAVVAVLIWLGWRYLTVWPYWLGLLWIMALFALVGYGMYHSWREFFSAERKEDHVR